MFEPRCVTDAEILSGFASLHEAIALGFAVVNQRFDSLEKGLRAEIAALEGRTLRRFDAMDRRFDAMDRRFDAMDQRFDGVDERLDRVEARVSALEKRRRPPRSSG